ncbi:MAG: AzlC family ABC transporter permease [Proteobacteria bacterium]|nr:AzlC family ABC transporter permease [Pseudomonadota bacterium]
MTAYNNTTKSTFWRGFRECMPFVLVVVPFGTLFGVAASEAGLDILQVMSFSVLVIAGAAQFSALALLQENAPTVIILLTSLAVNLRMAMYSAALVPHFGKLPPRMKMLISYFLVDQSFAMGIKEYEERPDQPVENKVAYFFGCMLVMAPFWYVSTYLGAALGANIPDKFSLDFAVPICFIALIAPTLRTVPHIVTALVSIIAALSLAWIPYSLGLIIAAILAMMAGAFTELKLGAGK